MRWRLKGSCQIPNFEAKLATMGDGYVRAVRQCGPFKNRKRSTRRKVLFLSAIFPTEYMAGNDHLTRTVPRKTGLSETTREVHTERELRSYASWRQIAESTIEMSDRSSQSACVK